jgi:cytochrome c-type biogenesis protein CcmH/NrfG
MASSTPTPDAAAKAAFQRGDYAAAEQIYRALLSAKPTLEPSVLSKFFSNHANCLLRLSRTADAEEACRHALRLRPDSINAHRIFADVLHRMAKEGQCWRIHDEVGCLFLEQVSS